MGENFKILVQKDEPMSNFYSIKNKSSKTPHMIYLHYQFSNSDLVNHTQPKDTTKQMNLPLQFACHTHGNLIKRILS